MAETQTMMSIAEFCKLHWACKKGREWAIANCANMQKVWETIDYEWLIWIATCNNVLTGAELRLFVCFCARQNWHLLTDEPSRKVIEMTEAFPNNECNQKELANAWLSAWLDAMETRPVTTTLAVWEVTVAARANYLREFCKPNFSN